MGFFHSNYDKPGPRIEKNAPKKHIAITFFETFFRNFWKFAPINFVYCLISAFGITFGLAASGMTHIARNIARDKHSFGLSDFFETIKKNGKQSFIISTINFIIYIVLFYNTYYFLNTKGTLGILGLGICYFLIFVFTIMSYYVWTFVITFKFTLKQIYSNSFKFVFLNFKNNLICFFLQLFVVGIYIGLLLLLKKIWLLVFVYELFIFILTFPGLKYLLIQFCVFPSIKKHIIDPYYNEHPDDDIELRKNLGLINSELQVENNNINQ